jgi:hypothetical protein
MFDSCINHVQGMVEVHGFLHQKQSGLAAFFISAIDPYQIFQKLIGITGVRANDVSADGIF